MTDEQKLFMCTATPTYYDEYDPYTRVYSASSAEDAARSFLKEELKTWMSGLDPETDIIIVCELGKEHRYEIEEKVEYTLRTRRH